MQKKENNIDVPNCKKTCASPVCHYAKQDEWQWLHKYAITDTQDQKAQDTSTLSQVNACVYHLFHIPGS